MPSLFLPSIFPDFNFEIFCLIVILLTFMRLPRRAGEFRAIGLGAISGGVQVGMEDRSHV